MSFVYYNTYRLFLWTTFTNCQCPFHLIHLELINLTVCDKECETWSCLLRSFSGLHHTCSQIQMRQVTLLVTEAILNYFLGQASPLCAVIAIYSLCLETFKATELDELFSGRQPHQMNYKIQRFGDELHLHQQGDVKSLRILLFANVSTALSCVYDCRHLALFRSCLQSWGILSHDYPAARYVYFYWYKQSG